MKKNYAILDTNRKISQIRRKGTVKMSDRMPVIEKAVLIDERRIELYWNMQMREADHEKNFRVYYAGEERKLVHWTLEDDWGYGTVYQKERLRTTLCMEEPVDVNCVDQLKIRVLDTVTDLMDIPVEQEKSWSVVYEPYYTQEITGEMGVKVRAGNKVKEDSLKHASEMVDIMLKKIPQVAQELQKRNVFLAVFALGENAYDIPEHRMGYLMATRGVEGFGGDIASVSESNVIRLRYGRNATAYRNESILAHEFGHSIHLSGINELEDQSLARRVVYCYEHALSEGLFPNTYAISNCEEYFATLCTIWFNVMQEGTDGTWDGVRGPVNTRAELAEYDPEGYELMSTIFEDILFPEPWDINRDAYAIDGSKKEEETVLR